MKPELSLTDDELSQRLQSWRVDAPLPPRFHEGVWRRIEQQNSPTPNLWQQCLEAIAGRTVGLLRQPVGAVTYLLTLGIVGGSLGYWSSTRFTDHAEAAWRTAYVQAVNPYSTAPER